VAYNPSVTTFQAEAFDPTYFWGRLATLNLTASVWAKPTPDIVDHDWSAVAPSFDGIAYTTYPAGDKPSSYVTVPTIVGLSLKAGSFTGGEGNNGFPLSIFGYRLGTKGNVGTTAGAKVYFRDPIGDGLWHEAAVYRYCVPSRVFTKLQLQELCVQPGNGAGFTPGRALDVKVTVNGVDTNVLFGAYKVQPGNTYFVSHSGNDSTGVANDINHPFRYLQFYNTGSNTYTGLWTLVQPGDCIIVRGDNGTTWTDATGAFGAWCAFQQGPALSSCPTGTAPTGAVGHGYLTIMGYPGEDVHGSFVTFGGFQGADSQRAQAGYGQYIQITNFRIDIQGGSPRDGAPINMQSGADNWVVTNNECGPWVAGSSSFMNSSAIGGQGSNCYVAFNHCHNIEGLSDLQNHGMYFGGVSGGTGYDNASFNMEVCYNWVHDCSGGSGIQFYWQGGNSKYMYGNKVHHNVVHDTAKYGLNAGESTTGYDAWDNIVYRTGWSALRVAPLPGTSATIRFLKNTIYAWNQSQGVTNPTAAVLQDHTTSGGNVAIFNGNIFCMQKARAGVINGWYVNNGASDDSGVQASQNLFFDPDGVVTTPWSIDSLALYSDPKFTDLTSDTYTVQAGSPALGAATLANLFSITTDVYGWPRPSSNQTIGATEGALT